MIKTVSLPIFLILLFLSNFRIYAQTSPPSVDKVGSVSRNLKHSLILPSPQASSRKVKELNLKEAILLALRNNPRVINSELQRIIEKFSAKMAANRFNPQYGLTAAVNYTLGNSMATYSVTPRVSLRSPLGTQIDMTYEKRFPGNLDIASITLSQPFLKNSGWTFNTINSDNVMDSEEIAKLNFRNNIAMIVISVINNYYALVEGQNNFLIQQKFLANSEKTLEKIRLQVRLGKLPTTSLLQQETNLSSMRLSMMRQKSNLEARYQNFLQSLGLVSQSKIKIDTKFTLKDYDIPSLDWAVKKALSNNLEYQANLIRLHLRERAVVFARNEDQWQLDFRVGATMVHKPSPYTNENGRGMWNFQKPNFGFFLNIPINKTLIRERILEARIALEQQKSTLEIQKENLVRSVKRQIKQLQEQKAQILLADKTVEMQKKVLKDAKLKLKYGKITAENLDQVQNQLFQQQINLLNAQIQFFSAITNLNQLLGITLENWGIELRY